MSLETDSITNDDMFLELLPVLVSGQTTSLDEPKFDELHGKRTKNRYVQLAEQREKLSKLGRIGGPGIVILYSSVGSRDHTVTVGGQDRQVTDRFYSESEHIEHFEAAEGLARRIGLLLTVSTHKSNRRRANSLIR